MFDINVEKKVIGYFQAYTSYFGNLIKAQDNCVSNQARLWSKTKRKNYVRKFYQQ